MTGIGRINPNVDAHATVDYGSLPVSTPKLSLGGSLYDPTDPMGMKRRCTGRYPSRADHPAVRHVHRRLVLHSLTPKIDRC